MPTNVTINDIRWKLYSLIDEDPREPYKPDAQEAKELIKQYFAGEYYVPREN